MKTTLYSKLLGLSLMLLMAAGLVACSQDNGDKKEEAPSFMETQQEKKTYGKIQKVDVGPNIDATMSKAGKETFEVKSENNTTMDQHKNVTWRREKQR